MGNEIDRLQKTSEKLDATVKKLEEIWAVSGEKSDIELITAGEDEFDDKSPARPEFCYGREKEVKKFEEFLEEIKEGKETKRGFLIRGASGTGKSSLSLKLKEEVGDLPFLIIDSRGYSGQDFFLKVFARFQEEIDVFSGGKSSENEISSGMDLWDEEPINLPIPRDVHTAKEFIAALQLGMKSIAGALNQKDNVELSTSISLRHSPNSEALWTQLV